MTDAYLYRIDLIGADVAKVGVTHHPADRIKTLRAQAPFDMAFKCVLRFADIGVAASWERHILGLANRHKARGEWVCADDRLDDLFSSVAPFDDCTSSFADDPSAGRIIRATDESASRASVNMVRLRAQVGASPAASVNYKGDSDDYSRAVIHARLRDGYGVEDIAVMDRIPIRKARAEVNRLRRAGRLSAVLKGLSVRRMIA